MSIVVAEPEIGGGGGCSIAEMYGQVLVIHECLHEQGVYYRLISDGPVEITAPETVITGDVRIEGDVTHNGDMVHQGNSTHTGDARVNGTLEVTEDIRYKGALVYDPSL